MDFSSLTPAQLASTPLLPDPSGAPPNFVDPPSRSGGAVIAMSVMLVITCAILSAKLFTRWRIVHQFGFDDWLILAAGVFMVATYALSVYILRFGAVGPHGWDVPLSKALAPFSGISMYVTQIMGQLPAALAKASLLWLLHRLFPAYTRRCASIAVWVGLGLNAATIAVVTIVYSVLCAPGADGMSSLTRCSDNTRLDIASASAALNVFLDLYVLAVAVPTIWFLQMSKRRKIGVVLILSVGLTACVCSILTLYFRLTSKSVTDLTWSAVVPIAVANYEGMVAIVTACLPSLPALWVSVQENVLPPLRRLFTTISRSSSLDNFSVIKRATSDVEVRNTSPASSDGGFHMKRGVTCAIAANAEFGTRPVA